MTAANTAAVGQATDPVVRVAVRVLAEQVHRHGDLHFRHDRPTTAEQGRKVHQHWQLQAGASAAAEVAVEGTWSDPNAAPGISLRVAGRIDAVLQPDSDPILVELKATRTDPKRLHAHAGAVHLAQLQLYAHLYRCQQRAEGAATATGALVGRLIYLQLGVGNKVVASHSVDASWPEQDAAAFFAATCLVFAQRLQAWRAWHQQRNQGLQDLPFPLPAFRPGQRELARAIYRTQADGSSLAAEAPTGTGKTLGALFPALKALAEGHGQRVFYATARTTGRVTAETASAQLAAAGAPLRVLTLSARERICPTPGTACEPDACPRAKGYFDRNRAALAQLLAHNSMPATTVAEVAEQHLLCPFELGLDAAPWSDVVIGDYNYIFDPLVKIQRLLPDSRQQHLLVDEAHNLPERARAMHSAQITGTDLALALRDTGTSHPLRRSVLAVRRALRACLPEDTPGSAAEQELPEPPAPLLRAGAKLLERWQQHQEAGAGAHSGSDTGAHSASDTGAHSASDTGAHSASASSAEHHLTELCFRLGRLQAVAEWYSSDSFAVLVNRSDSSLQLFCADPTAQLQAVLARQASTVLFSATPGPLPQFAAASGLPGARCVRLPSPFPPEHLGVFVVPNVSTLYRQRSHTLAAVTAVLIDMVRSRPGNHLAFLPSHAYLNMVADAMPDLPDVLQLRQTRAMPDAERQAFLAAYAEPPAAGQSRLGFAVMGGPFAEAVDLPGDCLIGVAIISTGLPPPVLEREVIRKRYQAAGEDGDLMAYRVPAVQRVLQTAGRLIRTETDRGVLVLVDARFLGQPLLPLLPAHWQVQRQPAAGLAAALAQFWAAEG